MLLSERDSLARGDRTKSMSKFSLLAAAMCVGTALAACPAKAVNVVIDYSYDTGNFFGSPTSGNPARAALDAAADYYTEILTDTFDGFTIPTPLIGQESTFTWSINFSHPSSGSAVALSQGSVAADEYRIYAGAANLSILGKGGPGGWARSLQGSGNLYGSEITEYNAKNGPFVSAVTTRGEGPTEYANWGGSITFDTNPVGGWHYDHNSLPGFNQNDFYSVAIHELAHAIGLGTSEEWQGFTSGNGASARFNGSAARAAYGSSVPLQYDTSTGQTNFGHWREGLMSTVYGASTPQEAVMDPTITRGTRKHLTSLDAAALQDIGWSVVPPVIPPLPGDYNDDNIVDAADYTIWRDSLGTANVIGNYAEWKANFGQVLGSGSLATIKFSSQPQHSIPEPGGATVAFLLLFAACAIRPMPIRKR